MSAAIAGEAYILHTARGRLRIRVSGWSGKGRQQLEAQLRQVQGVRSVQANPLTGNVLVQFDPARVDEQTVLNQVQGLRLDEINEQPDAPARPHVVKEKQGKMVRARIAVRGMDRDPRVARRVVERLEKRPGVHVHANPLTGRVLVEFAEKQADLDDLIAEITDVELPDVPDEDHPAYPLDPGPLVQSATRVLGSGLGLALLAAKRLAGREEALPGAEVAVHAAALIGLFQGIPPVRYGLRHLFGRTVADLIVGVPGIITLTLSSSLLGLSVVCAESLRLLTEVQARRAAWRAHEERIARAPSARPDAVIHLENGERAPLAAEVLEGTGTATGSDGMPLAVSPGVLLPPGARLYGGAFTVKLKSEHSFSAFTPQQRTVPPAPTLFERYTRIQAPIALAYAGATALLTRSFSRTLTALLLVNPRTAAIGMDNSDLEVNARVLRAGVTIVGTRPQRAIRRPAVLLFDGARLLAEKLELAHALPLTDEMDATEIIARAAGIANAAGSPWGGIFRVSSSVPASEGSFDGKTATAIADGTRYTLGPIEDWGALPEAAPMRQRGNYLLILRREQEERPLALFALRPRLAPGVQELVDTCERHGVEPLLLSTGDQLAVRDLARRAHIALVEDMDALDLIAARQQKGELVAFVSDNANAAAGFAACDLAIGLTDDRSRLPARADLLAPDLTAIAAIIEAGARREAIVRDSVGLAILSNIAGVIWGSRGAPGVATASRVVYVTALATLADGWLRLRGGGRARSTLTRLVDPQPERWGRRGVAEVLRLLRTSESGLSEKQARERWRKAPTLRQRNSLARALLDQARSPLTGILAAGATLSLILGSTGDVAIIGATIAANMLIGVWQEHKANQVAESLRQIGLSQAHVLRDNQPFTVPADEVVPGDILLLKPGDRIAADARVMSSQGLEVDEAALSGESLPVAKLVDGGNEANRIVLEGTDVTAGTGRAIVVAVSEQTRMGATRAALAKEEEQLNPLGVRLSRMLSFFLPISALGGATVVLSGLAWGRALTTLLATGATIALAGVPEGLPLLSRVGEAGVARRLAGHRAVVRRLSSIEALGRVDVACTDKTGTMTQGRLQLGVVADGEREATLAEPLPETLSHVLLTAALASPHPEAQGAHAHPTDVAVVQGAIAAGLSEQVYLKHEKELSFDPVRSFHATIVQGRLCIKGAPEVLLSRCQALWQHGTSTPLDEAGHARLLERARQLAERGLRVLMVAEGSPETSLENPRSLTALGFVGINDPLRPTVRAAVRRCREAGVRVIMITGDHPATALAIAREAGLLRGEEGILNAAEIANLENGELDQQLKDAVVIARATPLDKLRIIESLRRQGHTVAMTGDGVNDAPALRLADIGVAMGKSGTEVARQTADVVIADDDFSTLVEAFVEGRSFWHNTRRALGLLLGGNLGELGLVVGASLLGAEMPLTVSQILAVNAITDILPALAVILQQPEHRNLAELRREGISALNAPLRNEVLRRGLATTLPALAAYLLTLRSGTLAQARSVAFASIVLTQLGQTLMAGRAGGRLTRPVLAAVAGSTGILLAAFSIPFARRFLNLTLLSSPAWTLIGGSTLAAVLLNSLFAWSTPAGRVA
jgi:cation-transporting ATPase I